MISSVAYTPKVDQLSEASTFRPSKSPLVQILSAKIMLILLVFILGDICSQQAASMLITVGAGLEFWLTKNMGRKYLQAAWSVDTAQGQQTWIYEANFKSPESFEEIFWYSQILYGAFLIFAVALYSLIQKYSVLCSVVIAFTTNYVNFFAFSKIISMRNAGIFERIAQEMEAEGEIKETIRLPLVYRSTQNLFHQPLQSLNQSSLA